MAAEPAQQKNSFETRPPVPERQPIPEVGRPSERTVAAPIEQPVEIVPVGQGQPAEAPHRPPRPAPLQPGKSQQLVQIEKILEEDLAETYLGLSPKDQLRFKQKGEEVSKKIEHLLTKTKVKVRKIVSLLVNWLKTLPGVNRFFIETEAKIKADKIIKLKS